MICDLIDLFVYSLPKTRRYQHTAGLNISGSFLLGAIYAMPTIDVGKLNQLQSSVGNKSCERFQGLSPRAKLMLGVGYVVSLCHFVGHVCVFSLREALMTYLSLSIICAACSYFMFSTLNQLLWQVSAARLRTFESILFRRCKISDYFLSVLNFEASLHSVHFLSMLSRG
jgi:hypothetical protein